jgi:hypothetical protein
MDNINAVYNAISAAMETVQDTKVSYVPDTGGPGFKYFLCMDGASGTTSGLTETAYIENTKGCVVFDGYLVEATYGFYETSDERLKNFGPDIVVDESIVKSIPKRYFTWKEGDDDRLHIGTSAQEVARFFPEIVDEDKEGNMTVDYAKLSIVALSAIENLYDENEKLRKRIERLENLMNQ